ncbi:MAG TPA: hypothetical protein P5121_05640 [Caldilineaceae bacterium]|nr:hypothetical protein [Caldilineaceae bacterium]
MIYLRFARFLLPLAITSIVLELGTQVLNAGMARVPHATTTLAGFGVAWGIILFFTSPLAQAKELGLVMGDGPAARKKVRRFVIVTGCVLILGLGTLALTSVGHFAIEDLHNIDETLGATVRTALLWLMPYPLIRGTSLYHAGLLIRHRRTTLVSYAIVASISTSVATVFLLLSSPFVNALPIRLPIAGVYAGILVELAVILWGYRFTVTQEAAAQPSSVRPKVDIAPTYAMIIRFFWPLALIMMIQEFSRPLINLYVSRQSDGPEALAVLAVIYILGRIPYGWLNDIRNLPAAFRHEANNLHHIRRFAAGCALLSMTLMVLLFWTPLSDVILRQWTGLDATLAAMSSGPLHLFVIFSLVVAIRGYYHGLGLVERRTAALAPSAPLRLVAIWLTLLLLPIWQISGALLGVIALLNGFIAETITVWWGVRGRSWLRKVAVR